MGSLLSSSRPAYSPVTTITPTASSTPSSANTADDVQDDTSVVSGGTDADAARDFVRRSARGKGSTILTSFRGVLTAGNTLAPQRKNLLGE